MIIDVRVAGSGQTIRNLVSNQVRLAGPNTEYWDGRKNDGTFYVGRFDVYYGIPQNIQLHALIIKQPPLIAPETLKAEAYLILPLFGEVSTVTYTLNRQVRVTLEIQDPNGSHFRTLAQNELQTAGPHSVEWDGRDDAGALASVEGSYRVTLTAEEAVSGGVTTQIGSITVHR